MTQEPGAIGRFDQLVNGFIPAGIAADRVQRKQARLFLVSHLCGPFIGATVPVALFVLDPHSASKIGVLAASILLFWIYPILLRWGMNYNVLALLSIQNLMFCINWGNLISGGISSPTLPWFLTIPLLMFFYLGPRYWVRIVYVIMISANLAAFYGIQRVMTIGQVHISPGALQMLGIVSTIAAATYVAMMALFYARALASQAELETEMRDHAAIALELRRSLEAAERTGATKAAFLETLSSQSRGPLSTVIGYSELLIYDAAHDEREDRGDELERIREAGNQLLRLVNDVLDLAKIEAGEMEIFSETFRPDDLVASIAREMAPTAAANGNTLDIEVGGDLGTMCSDMRKIRIVLFQLVSNAIKFTAHGSIMIHAHAERDPAQGGRILVFRVQDTGIGIDADAMPTLFERFALNDDASASRYGGSGLGLALSRKLCRLLGGDIAIDPDIEDGSCFTVRIPCEAAKDGPMSPSDCPVQPTPRPLVLPVDTPWSPSSIPLRDVA